MATESDNSDGPLTDQEDNDAPQESKSQPMALKPAVKPFPKPKFENALDFLEKLKVACPPRTYNAFLDIMKEFKMQTLDMPGLIPRVKALFADQPELVRGFNVFLPPAFQMDDNEIAAPAPAVVPPVPSAGPLFGGPGLANSNNNLVYASRVKAYCGANTDLWYRFQGLCNQRKTMNADELARELQHIFGGNLYLTAGFAHFDESAVDFSSIPESSWTNIDPLSIPLPPLAMPPQAGPHYVSVRAGPMPEFEHARDYVKNIKVRFASNPEIYKAFLELLHNYHKDSHSIEQVHKAIKELFAGHPDLIRDFEHFLPTKAPAVPLPASTSTPVRTQPPQQYLQTVQERFRESPAIVENFHKLLREHEQHVREMHTQVHSLFSCEPDLMEGFAAFLAAKTESAVRTTP